MNKSIKEIKEHLADQKPNPGEELPVNDDTRTRALVGILNTQVVIAELLLDIREILKKPHEKKR